MEMGKASKVLVIGLDGGTFDILRPLAEEGRLPTLARLMREGVCGELTSTIPPITAAAWTSFATGKNPGKHGLVDFVYFPNYGYSVSVASSKNRRAKAIWNILGEEGRKVGVVSVPMTYPPEPVNGFMVTGMMTPPSSKNFAYPPELMGELTREVGEYVIHAGEGVLPSDLERYLDKMRADIAIRVKCTLYLLRKYDPDFFMFVFGALDPLQHQFFNYIDVPSQPSDGNEMRERILSVYEEVDARIAEILEMADEDTTLIFMSDHGFGPLEGFLHLNNWFLDKGYLTLKHDIRSRVKYLLFRAGFTPEAAHNLARRLRLDLRRRVNRGRAYRKLQRIFLSFEDIDWEATKAYALGHIGQIYINLRGRQPQGVVEPGAEYEELREKIGSELLDLVSPVTGERAIERVYKREEIYRGENLEQAPDLLLIPKGFSHVAFGESEFGSNRLFGPTLGHTGHHRLNGILIMQGPEMRSGQTIEGANIVDLAPTILYAMGYPIPRDMDGRVLTEAFHPQFLEAQPISYGEAASAEEEQEKAYSEADETEVRERLKGLGYIA